MKNIYFIFFLLCFSCVDEENESSNTTDDHDLVAKVIYLKDGDSFVVLDGKEEVEVRMINMDAPELYQAHGKKAKQYLSKLIKGKRVGIDFEKKDRYGRILGEVYLNNQFINLEMVKGGYAWNFDRFSRDEDIMYAEDSARDLGIGLWQDKNPEAPWEWRKSHRR
jgi:endonuclease YncB( thermonuclease family)